MRELKLACVSDIHLGHKRNETRSIIDNLMAAFPDNARTGDLDILILAGDVFDGLLTLPHVVIADIDRWILYVLQLCKKHDIVLRVLEGTPSHDWKQSIRFEILNDIYKVGCDLKYVQELSIEYIERFDASFLYVPDEWGESTEKTLSEVHQLLRLKGLDQVDYAIMHGQFEHQLPPHIKKGSVHNLTEYLKIVDKLIFIGHIHIYSVLERAIAQGSFDRLSHGEEGPKGHVRATVRSREDYELTFVENKGARQYITIDCTSMVLEDTLRMLRERLKDIPDHSAVRLACHVDNPILVSKDQFTKDYPFISWSTKLNTDGDALEIAAQDDDELSKDDFVPITITSQNITRLVLDRIMQKGLSPEVLQRTEQFLTELR